MLVVQRSRRQPKPPTFPISGGQEIWFNISPGLKRKVFKWLERILVASYPSGLNGRRSSVISVAFRDKRSTLLGIFVRLLPRREYRWIREFSALLSVIQQEELRCRTLHMRAIILTSRNDEAHPARSLLVIMEDAVARKRFLTGPEHLNTT